MKDYLRCVAGVDENVGRLLKYLDENGLTDNTVVIYTGDQGFFLGEHGWFDKRLMYEETIKMPLLIRYPQEIKPRTVNDDMVMNIDFAPLFLDYAGLPVAPEMQGESFRSNLKGATPELWRKSIYYRYWMHADREHNVCAHYGIRTERYKLIYFYGQPLGMTGTADKPLTPEWELYDMQADPKEMNNLYNAFKNDPVRKPLLNELKTELIKIKARYNDADSKYPQLETLNKTYFWE